MPPQKATAPADVDVISSVSGGSFTAAHYALFGTEGFRHFEEDFLYRNIQGELVPVLDEVGIGFTHHPDGNSSRAAGDGSRDNGSGDMSAGQTAEL